jgi:hypothetical protein
LPGTLHGTLDAIKSLVVAWNQQGYRNRVIAFAVSFPIEDRDLAVSIMGNMRDVETWLSRANAPLPINRDDLIRWLDESADYLHESYPPSKDLPSLLGTLSSTGELRLNRRAVVEFPYRFVPPSADNDLPFEAGLSPETIPLWNAMNTGAFTAATAFIAAELQCRKCHSSYEKCDCSKVLDSNVSVAVKNIRRKFLFWADGASY